MSLATHIYSLEAKHEHLEHLLDDELHRPMPDFTVMQSLKKQKLLIKEELARITGDDSRAYGSQDGAA
ncbi:MAG: DUF465 domain-containing protein [Rickettsiales bacterium]|nr:DUF465 domain-containing protein [Rickettsiales bacterium]